MNVYDVEVEAQAKSVEEAKQLAVEKLGLPADRVEFTVVQEGKPGFLGIGGQPAVITARAKPEQKSRGRRRGRRGGEAKKDTGSSARRGSSAGGREERPMSEEKPNRRPEPEESNLPLAEGERPDAAPIEEQATVAREFLSGLLEAFGLEGEITTEVDGDVLSLKVLGGQSEALVGQRGIIMHSVLELTRTVIQRKTFGAPRMRIDIAGYGERRREALTIYAGKLAEKVLAEGGEIMLEPMNPADRKVVHDAIAAIEGVRSYSEGEDPERSVVIVRTD